MTHTKNTIFTNSLRLSILTLAVTLAACGGGGGGGSASNTAAVAPVATANSVALVTSVPAPTYVRGSGEEAAFNYLNAERSRCGFGMLTQNVLLDKAATNHSAYWLVNQADDPHLEVVGHAGYTGVWPTDRAKLVGYQTDATEVYENGGQRGTDMRNLQFTAARDTNLLAYEGIRGLLNTPIHEMLGAFSTSTEVGIGVQVSDSTVNGIQNVSYSNYFEFGFGKTVLGQLPPAGTGIRTYPCEGTASVALAFKGEWVGGLDVYPGRNIFTNPLGSAVMVFGEQNKTLELTSATFTQVSTGLVIPTYVLRTKANDPTASYYRNDWTGYVTPDQPYITGQQYSVVINGKSGGVQFSKTVTFTAE